MWAVLLCALLDQCPPWWQCWTLLQDHAGRDSRVCTLCSLVMPGKDERGNYLLTVWAGICQHWELKIWVSCFECVPWSSNSTVSVGHPACLPYWEKAGIRRCEWPLPIRICLLGCNVCGCFPPTVTGDELVLTMGILDSSWDLQVKNHEALEHRMGRSCVPKIGEDPSVILSKQFLVLLTLEIFSSENSFWGFSYFNGKLRR